MVREENITVTKKQRKVWLIKCDKCNRNIEGNSKQTTKWNYKIHKQKCWRKKTMKSKQEKKEDENYCACGNSKDSEEIVCGECV